MSYSEIPSTWQIVKFGESCAFSQGIQVDVGLQSESKGDKQVRFLRIVDFTKGDEPARFIDNPGERYYLKNDEIAMVRYGTVGFVCSGKEGVIANNLFKITPQEYLNSSFLRVFLNSQLFKSKLESKGATMQALSFGLINPIQIPLPPLSEQHRIVAKIEELFSELDKGVETLKTAKQQLKVYRQAVLKYAFEGKLTNPDVKEGELPEGWSMKTIEEVAQTIGGLAFKSSDFSTSGKYQVIRMGNVRQGVIRYSESPVFLDKIEDKQLEKGLLRLNDVIITQTGTRGKRDYGFTSLIKSENLLLNQRIAAIRCKSLLMPKYLLYYTWTDTFKNQFFANETGNVGQGNVGIKGITQSLVPYPIFSEQERIVQEIESRLSVCDKIEESIEQGLQQAEVIRQSILKKAFKGKLVPQDPNDEPASVLLERIKAERAAAQTVNKTKTKKVI